MRRVALLVVILGCKAGEVSDGDQRGFARPVEAERSQPIPGEGAASPTTPADPADTPSPAAEAEDPWIETSTDPWAPTTTKEATVTATPALDETDPWAPTSTDPWAPTQKPKAKKPVLAPIR